MNVGLELRAGRSDGRWSFNAKVLQLGRHLIRLPVVREPSLLRCDAVAARDTLLCELSEGILAQQRGVLFVLGAVGREEPLADLVLSFVEGIDGGRLHGVSPIAGLLLLDIFGDEPLQPVEKRSIRQADGGEPGGEWVPRRQHEHR